MASRNFCDRKGCEREIPAGDSIFSVALREDVMEDSYGKQLSKYSVGIGRDSEWRTIQHAVPMLCRNCAREISNCIREIPEPPKPVVSDGTSFTGKLKEALGDG